MTQAPVITIDGPSGSGKGTVARQVARQLGWHLLDSGALYRLVALAGQQLGLGAGDSAGHAAVARNLPIRFDMDDAGNERIWCGDPLREVTALVRSEQGGQGASRVAVWPEVRAALLDRQWGFARPPGLVADGRDMGTVVFPGADLKIYLTASAAERARRRFNQLRDTSPALDLAALSREIAERDLRDTTRAVSPLVPARDAVIIDTSSLDAGQVAERVLEEARQRGLGAGPSH